MERNVIDLRDRKGTIIYGEDLFTQDEESYQALVNAGYEHVTLLPVTTKYAFEGIKDPLYELKGFHCGVSGSTYFIKDTEIKVKLVCRSYSTKKTYYYPNLGEKFGVLVTQTFDSFVVQVTDYNRFKPTGFRYTQFFVSPYVDKDFINKCCREVANIKEVE